MQILLIDAMNLIRRMYAGIPDSQLKSEACAARCVQAVAQAAKNLSSTHCAIVFEDREPTWRHEMWVDYKLGRQPMPDELRENLKLFWRAFKQAGMSCLFKSGWEADDIIATVADKAKKKNIASVIMSTDKGFYQLVDDQCRVLNYFDRKLFDQEEVFARYGVQPNQLVDLLALTGDNTNHLPGIKGIGIKTATQLLQAHQDLDGIFVAIDQLTDRQQKLIQAGWQQASLTRKLARLSLNVELGCNISQLRYQPASNKS